MTQRDRIVRVFISSTFRDMHAEREVLVKHIFPRLRKLCEERGVAFVDVDLRWGVTEEQADRGEVLPICLAEIDRCRPYFVGLLGERYGWVPQEIPQELIDQQSWLGEHRQKSVTELEIVHGVLRNPAMINRAGFYFRDPLYVEQIPPDQQAAFVETDPVARQKLTALKETIRNSGLTWREYRDPEALGQLVFDDLAVAINQDFPQDQTPDALQREALEHEAFAQSRSGVYIGRPEYFDRLDEHARGSEDGPGLVVLGESGSGKSALLANWALRHRQENPAELVLMHFIGASPYSADWVAMLRRILKELKRRFDIEQEVPDDPDALRSAFANWLHMAAARGRVVLMLDGLNQLDDRNGAPDLVWLPPVIPANVRLILSTLSGRPLEELTRRGWPTLTVKPFEPDERRRFIGEYLAQFTKSLSTRRIERIAAAPAAANPLYLQALLEELRVFGVHERIDERIDHYLAATTVEGLYERILERYEADYERDRPGLVRDAMTLLWAARRGLSETELLDLLGVDDKPLPQAHWSPLYLAAERSLVSRSGLLGFFHEYLRRAVENRYLPTDEQQHAAHLHLADYFNRQELNHRKIDELPWQLAEAAAWQRLYDLLAGLPFFAAAWKADQYEVKAHWARVEKKSDLHLVNAYRAVLDDPAAYLGDVWNLGALLNDTGNLAEALSLREYLVDYCRTTGDRARLGGCLVRQASILYGRGNLHLAIELYQEAEQICRESGDWEWCAASLNAQARIFRDRGDLDRAIQIFQEEEQIHRELGNKTGLATFLNNQASIPYLHGDLGLAMQLYQEAERICRELGDRDGIATSLVNQALILHDSGNSDRAIQLLQKAERICRDQGNTAVLVCSLSEQAVILRGHGDLDLAMQLHEEEEHICRELGNRVRLAASLGHQAVILRERGDLDLAMQLHKESEQIYRDLGNRDGTAMALGGQAVILRECGDLDLAMQLHKESEQIYRDLGKRASLATSLGNQALILRRRGNLSRAMQLFQEEEQIYRELADRAGIARSWNNQALILMDQGDLDGAMRLFHEKEYICRELGNTKGIIIAIGNQAELLAKNRNQPQDALPLAEEAYRMALDHGYTALAERLKRLLDEILAMPQ